MKKAENMKQHSTGADYAVIKQPPPKEVDLLGR